MKWSGTKVDSPVGPLFIAVDEEGRLTRLEFAGSDRPPVRMPADVELDQDPATCREVTRQLDEYFAMKRRDFEIRVALVGTDFQKRVWNELLTIPYGATTTYGSIAQRLGKPSAMRAVGLANGSNPIAIVVPCHRVIGANGSLVGYGGGLDVKTRLLELERMQRPLF
jgi:methylated-DNA-[protein]-cysteine S-methyltransferase